MYSRLGRKVPPVETVTREPYYLYLKGSIADSTLLLFLSFIIVIFTAEIIVIQQRVSIEQNAVLFRGIPPCLQDLPMPFLSQIITKCAGSGIQQRRIIPGPTQYQGGDETN